MDEKKRFIRLPEVMLRTGLSRTTIYDWIALGRFPKAIRLGKKMSVWLESDIDQWMSKQLSGHPDAA